MFGPVKLLAALGTAAMAVLIPGGAVAHAATPRGLGITLGTAETLIQKIDGEHLAFAATPGIKKTPSFYSSSAKNETNILLSGQSTNLTTMSFRTYLDPRHNDVLARQRYYDSLICAKFAGSTAENWCEAKAMKALAKSGTATTSTHAKFKAAKPLSGQLLFTIATSRAIGASPPYVLITITQG